MTKKTKGPQFSKFINPIIQALKELGDSGTASEVTDHVIDMLQIPEEKLEETLKNGTSRIRNQIAWARMYLVKADYMDSSQRGIWSLTEKGINSKKLTQDDIVKIFKVGQGRYTDEEVEPEKNLENKQETISQDDDLINGEVPELDRADHKEKLLKLLQDLPPKGFERICQRLLRESGFQQVKVTGKSGDGGIDGEGILAINPLVSFKVIFQSKRYKGSVSSSTVRDFRGAMQGRAEKGIIITTGSFSQDAKKEARREGPPPIELVDGEGLVKLFEEKELGLKPKTVFEIDEKFFDEFR